jgi:hypothetical protein
MAVGLVEAQAACYDTKPCAASQEWPSDGKVIVDPVSGESRTFRCVDNAVDAADLGKSYPLGTPGKVLASNIGCGSLEERKLVADPGNPNGGAKYSWVKVGTCGKLSVLVLAPCPEI